MFDRIRKLFDPQPLKPGMTRSLLRELDSLEPGQAMVITAVNGSTFTVMHTDDFDHIAALAGLRGKAVTDDKEVTGLSREGKGFSNEM